MRRGIALLGALVLVLAAASVSIAVPLSTLLNGGSITAGDKVFDNWSKLFYDAADGRTFNADNIDVTALADGGLDPGPGLRFTVLNDELNVIGTEYFDYVDLMFGFRVSVLDPTLRIKDSSIAGLGGGWGIDSAQLDYDVGWYINESTGPALGLDDLGAMNVQLTPLGPPQVFDDKLSDSAAFSPQSEIWVTKNILVWANYMNGSAELTGFDERFSQISVGVPEPGMLSLLVLGGLALLRFKRS